MFENKLPLNTYQKIKMYILILTDIMHSLYIKLCFIKNKTVYKCTPFNKQRNQLDTEPNVIHKSEPKTELKIDKKHFFSP